MKHINTVKKVNDLILQSLVRQVHKSLKMIVEYSFSFKFV